MSKNILLVYPKMPRDTFWSFSRILHFIGKKANMPPLGLITVAAMLPEDYNLRLVDMNIESLDDADINWADAVFTSSLIAQKDSLDDVIRRANSLKVPIVAGGPFPTQYFDKIDGVDHFVLGEVESGSLDLFLADFENDNAKKVYANHILRKKKLEKEMDEKIWKSILNHFGEENVVDAGNEWPSIGLSPIPRFDLLKIKEYASMAVQLSRGCPHSCDFCSESVLYGHKPRLKTPEKMIAELNRLYELGHRGAIMAVDDNFIGNRKEVKNVLQAIKDYQAERVYPFSFFTEVDITLSKYKDLMGLMRDSCFNMIFVGLESPDETVLRSMGKNTNIKINLKEAVREIQSYGMEVTAGLIVGTDDDPPDICDKIFEFCQETGIALAMVSPLSAMRGAPLYERIVNEGRFLDDFDGNNTHGFRLNFIPQEAEDLAAEKGIVRGSVDYWEIVSKISQRKIDDYKNLLERLYDRTGKNYFERCKVLFENLGKQPKPARDVGLDEVRAFGMSLFNKEFSGPFRDEYLKFIVTITGVRIDKFPEAIAKTLMGYHLRQITCTALGLESSYNPDTLYKFVLDDVNSVARMVADLYREGRRLQERIVDNVLRPSYVFSRG